MKCEQSYACHGGSLTYYMHHSDATQTQMRFSLFLPPKIKEKKSVPLMLFLSGLTCTEENFTTKAGAYQKAAELGIAILAPDTSPRGENVPDNEAYDLGQGAGFYIDATQAPWAKHFQMESYLMKELLPLIEQKYFMNTRHKFICGHSMGGHGALTLYFKYPEYFTSCSAFSPIVAPTKTPWGHKAFTAYLGKDRTEWQKHDACALVAKTKDANQNLPILIDQGLSDQFLDNQLKPQLFKDACDKAGQQLNLRTHRDYDHSYFFIQSFINDHLEWHYGNFARAAFI